MSAHSNIDKPGDYLITITWAQATEVGQKLTPAYKVLCKTANDQKIYATLWMSEKAKAGSYWQNLRHALGLQTNPGRPEQIMGKTARITVDANDRGYMEVVRWSPAPAEMPAREPKPPTFNPPVPPADDGVPF